MLVIKSQIWRIRRASDGSKTIHSLPSWRFRIRSDGDLLDEEITWLNVLDVDEIFEARSNALDSQMSGWGDVEDSDPDSEDAEDSDSDSEDAEPRSDQELEEAEAVDS
jgi:hypothetical protein